MNKRMRGVGRARPTFILWTQKPRQSPLLPRWEPRKVSLCWVCTQEQNCGGQGELPAGGLWAGLFLLSSRPAKVLALLSRAVTSAEGDQGQQVQTRASWADGDTKGLDG